jgi:hypothetical protein
MEDHGGGLRGRTRNGLSTTARACVWMCVCVCV